jgi:hypothetical protein
MSALVASYGQVEMRRRFDEDEEDTDGNPLGFDDNEDDEDLDDGEVDEEDDLEDDVLDEDLDAGFDFSEDDDER